MRRVGRRTGLILVVLLLAPGAQAHQPAQVTDSVPVLAPLPAALGDIKLQLHKTLAPQLVAENTGPENLEIEDSSSRVFLRIGPTGVQADLNALSWYQSYLPHGIAAPRGLRTDAPPRWVTLRREPSWGWFDPRLNPPAAPASSKTWQIPMRLNGQRHLVRGCFEARARPQGIFESRLTSPAELAAGVSVQLVHGQPAALLLKNTSGETVTILGRQQEPVIKVTPQGVSVNLLSATWRDFGRGLAALNGEALKPVGADQTHWIKVSAAPRYSWIEPRSAYPEREPPQAIRQAGTRVTVLSWQVPLNVGTRRVMITGATDWAPLPPQLP